MPTWLVATVVVVCAATFLVFLVSFCMCVVFKKPKRLTERKLFYEDDEPISLDMIHLKRKKRGDAEKESSSDELQSV